MLSGDNVKLRELDESDLAKLKEWDKDEEFRSFVGRKGLRGKAAAHMSLKEWYAAAKRDGRRFAMGIVKADDNELIGDIELEDISWRRRSGELTVAIGPREYWSQGYGREAVELCLGYAFDSLGLDEVYLRVYTDNRRAIRCYENCGFEKEGVLTPRGRREDHNRRILLMSKRRSDWQSSS